jgi:hypothetical protein
VAILMRKNILIALLVLFAGSSAPAQVLIDEKPEFLPTYWKRGIHFLPGFGVNTSIFDSKVQDSDTGWGGSIRMDIGYYFTNDFALELSSSVNLNRVDGYLMWDNQFNFGARTRLTFLKSSDNGSPYARIFAGRGPLVVVFEKKKPAEYAATGAQRLQLEGPVFGGALGLMQLSSQNSVWYMELMVSHHKFKSLEVIKSSDVAPVIISQETIKSRSTFTTLHLIFGIVAF